MEGFKQLQRKDDSTGKDKPKQEHTHAHTYLKNFKEMIVKEKPPDESNTFHKTLS